MQGTEVAAAVLTFERHESFLSAFLTHHRCFLTRLQLSEMDVNEVYVCLSGWNTVCPSLTLLFGWTTPIRLGLVWRTPTSKKRNMQLSYVLEC